MRVHIIHAHSETNSFVSAMKDTARTTFELRGDTVTVSDLYAKKFDPVASPGDFSERLDKGRLTYPLEQRNAYKNGTLKADIAAEIQPVLEADILMFTFPVYWFSVPAILKGWFDRVLLSGVCYGGRRIYGAGGLAGKRSLIATSLGGREHMFGAGAIHGELVTGMLRHLLQGTLGYVGTTVLEPFVAFHVPYISDEQRRKELVRLRQILLDLDDRAVLPMPDLGGFDEQFAPRTI